MTEGNTPMSADMEFYDRHCRPSFERLEKAMGRIEHSLNGNGKPGLLTRVDRLEQSKGGEKLIDGVVVSFLVKNWAVLLILLALGVGRVFDYYHPSKADIEQMVQKMVELKQVLPYEPSK